MTRSKGNEANDGDCLCSRAGEPSWPTSGICSQICQCCRLVELWWSTFARGIVPIVSSPEIFKKEIRTIQMLHLVSLGVDSILLKMLQTTDCENAQSRNSNRNKSTSGHQKSLATACPPYNRLSAGECLPRKFLKANRSSIKLIDSRVTYSLHGS